MLSVKYNSTVDPSHMAQALGRRGGLARARRLTVADRTRIASMGGAARRESLRAARRIADNFEYLAAVRDLAPPAAPVRRVKTFRGPLPGIYAAATHGRTSGLPSKGR